MGLHLSEVISISRSALRSSPQHCSILTFNLLHAHLLAHTHTHKATHIHSHTHIHHTHTHTFSLFIKTQRYPEQHDHNNNALFHRAVYCQRGLNLSVALSTCSVLDPSDCSSRQPTHLLKVLHQEEKNNHLQPC